MCRFAANFFKSPYILLIIFLFFTLNPVLAQSLPSGPLTRYSGNPLIKNGPDLYDLGKAGPRVVRKEGSIYRIWYEAVSNTGFTTTAYATSADGLNWTKQGIQISPALSWEGNEVSPNFILVENGVYKLWYHAGGIVSDGVRRGGGKIGYATSSDGLSWSKRSQPVFVEGPSGSFDDEIVAEPRVFNIAGQYRMYYTGKKYNGPTSLGMATSQDGITWTRYPGNPIISASQWGNFWGGAFFFDGSTWHLWHGKTPSGLHYKYSNDGIIWTNGPNNPVLSINPNSSAPDSGLTGDTVSGYLDGMTYRILYTGFNMNLPNWGRFEGICMASIGNIPTNSPQVVLKPGDANRDNRVDGLDYIVWLTHYGQNVSGASNGNFNGAGRVDGLDYVVWLTNYGR